MDTRKVYILLSYTGTMPSKVIKLWTRKTYTHVSLALDKDFRRMYSFGRKYLRYPLIGGFVKEDPDKGIFAIFKNTFCKVYELNVTNDQYQKIEDNIDYFIINKKKFKYNFLGLLGVILNKTIVIKNRYFCSQFVAKVLEDSDLNVINKPSELATPQDFINSNSLKEVYTGQLSSYRKEPIVEA